MPTITGELRRHYRDKGSTIRVPLDLQELNLRLGRAQEEAAVALGRPATAADRLLARLAPRERMILELRFHQVMSQSEISARIGISQMQVSRLLRRSLAQLNAMADEET